MSPSSANDPAGNAGLLRAVLTLMTGTAFARALAMGSQLVLAVWLTPADFGLWAAATSSLVFLSGLTNLGEVNGYLSGESLSFAATRRTTRKVNAALMLLALTYAGYCAVYRSVELAVLCAIIAITLPLQGESSLLSAAGTKLGYYRAVVSSQMLGAVCKLVLGVVLAAAHGAAFALALSTTGFFVAMWASLYRRLPRERLFADPPRAAVTIPLSARFKWSVNSLMMQLPIQAGFLVAQFLSNLNLLGLYFFSYQITLGVSGLVAEPLARIGLSALADEPDRQRRRDLALWFCTVFAAGTLVVVGVAAAIAGSIDFLPEKWKASVPMTIVLLSSMPIRMTAPIVDSIQQANNRWWQATSLNAIDAVGTGIASASILFGDPVLLALCVAAWKIVFGVSRLFLVFGRTAAAEVAGLVVPVVAGSMLIWASFIFSSACPPWLSLMSSALGAMMLGRHLDAARSRRDPRDGDHQ